MNINATILGELLTFAVLVWATMKYIWPPVMKIMQERQEKIAMGLAAAQDGQRQLEESKKKCFQQINEAKTKANLILDRAHQEASNMIEEGRIKAQEEYDKILAKAKSGIEQELNKVKQELRHKTVDIVITATEKVLQEKIDASVQRNLIDKLIGEI